MAQPKVTLKSQQRERTRKRLLDAALSLFASKGYEATSIGDICLRTALSKGAFYFHFPGKEALLGEALQEATELGSGDWDFWSSRSAGSSGRTSAFRESRPGLTTGISPGLQLELWGQALRQEQVWHHLRRSRTRIAAALRRRLRRQLGGAADVEALARGLVALRDGLAVHSLLFPDDRMEARLHGFMAALARHAPGGEPFRQFWDLEHEKRLAWRKPRQAV